MVKERALSTGTCKLPQGSLPRKIVVRITAGAQFEGDLGEILALGAKILPYIGLREKWEPP